MRAFRKSDTPHLGRIYGRDLGHGPGCGFGSGGGGGGGGPGGPGGVGLTSLWYSTSGRGCSVVVRDRDTVVSYCGPISTKTRSKGVVEDDRYRTVALERIAEHYGADATSDFRRSAVFALLATVLVAAAVVLGTRVIATGHGQLSRGIAIASLLFAASIPYWWLCDRYRRSALEHRRLQRQSASIEPFVAGLGTDSEDIIRAAIAQRLFARTAEETDPMSSCVWPTSDNLLAARRPLVEQDVCRTRFWSRVLPRRVDCD